MTENEFTYWAFVSYSQQDNLALRSGTPGEQSLCWGDWWKAALQSFSIPAEFIGTLNARGELIPERIAPIFQDQEESPDQTTLSESVRQALAQSRCLVVICSPRSAQSLHVNETVRYFKQLGRAHRILPVVIAGEPNATEGEISEKSAADECFVPALRHPVNGSGELDLTRRERGYIFADARHGETRLELLPTDAESPSSALETARVQLLAGLIGVSPNGLWGREQKRRLASVQRSVHQTPPASTPILPPVSEQNSAALLEAEQRAETAQLQIRELKQQVESAERNVATAQAQASAAQIQIGELQAQAQTAEDRARAAELLAQETERQLTQAREEYRELQRQFLQIQNLPLEANTQIERAQTQLLEVQTLAQTAQAEAEVSRQQARDAQNKVAEAQAEVRLAQTRLQQIEQQAQQTQIQLTAAQNEAQTAAEKFLTAQQQLQASQQQVQAAQNEAQTRQRELVATQAQIAESQQQIRELQTQAAEAERQSQLIRQQMLATQEQAQAASSQTRTAQSQVLESVTKTQAAQRLTKFFAVLAALASLAAAFAWWQREVTNQKLVAAGTENPAGPLTQEQIQQALQRISKIPANEASMSATEALANQVAPANYAATLNIAADLLNDPVRSEFQGHILDVWARTNWSAAFDWSCQLTNISLRQLALAKTIPAVAADQLTNTLSRLNSLQPPPAEADYALLFQRWATENPAQALDQRSQIPRLDAEDKMTATVLDVWSTQQPAAALAWLTTHTNSGPESVSSWRQARINNLFQYWATKDLDAATAACQQLPADASKDNAYAYLLSQRIVLAPATAADLITNLPAGDYRAKAIADLCLHWAATNAPAVFAWAQNLTSISERTAVTNQALSAWVQHDQLAAAQFAEAHPELPAEIFGKIASAWQPIDFAGSSNWVTRLPNGEKKQAALAAMAESWSRRNVSSAAAWAATLPDSDDQKAAVKGLISTWSITDPAAAANLLLSFSATNAQPELLSQTIKNWAQSEPAATAKWLGSLPTESANEANIHDFLEGACRKYPEFAAQWTLSITDAERRQQYQTELARRWLKIDPAAATRWIEGSELPEALKQSLINPAP